jgi:uncharacterized protein YlxW (UPF0749 family)
MSLFAFVTAAVMAKLRTHSDLEATRRIAELEAEVKDLQARLDVALEDVRRWEALAASWQRRYQERDLPQMQQYAAAMQQYAAIGMAQVNPFYQQGLLGAQNLDAGRWHDCTCVPGRADAFRLG